LWAQKRLSLSIMMSARRTCKATPNADQIVCTPFAPVDHAAVLTVCLCETLSCEGSRAAPHQPPT
jgi:hypothetical protein